MEGGKDTIKKLKITLACASGMSTTMLCKKIIAAAEQRGYECECEAYGISTLSAVAPGSDLLLLGPQVRYRLEEIRKSYPNIPVEVINMMDYGAMNGEKIFSEMAQKYGW